MEFLKYMGSSTGDLYDREDEYVMRSPKDTHKENKVPSWKIRAMELKNRDIDFDQIREARRTYSTNEVGFKHPEQNSYLKFSDNGDIKMMSGENSGISINNKYKTTNIYGQSTNINSKIFNINTMDGGLLINKYILNPQLYMFCNLNFNEGNMCDLKLDATVKYWKKTEDNNGGYWTEKSIAISPFIPTSEDTEYSKIINRIMEDGGE